jgi:tRNA-splicing ligase RtcB
MKVITSEKLPIKMWLCDIEDSALQQAKNLANHPFSFKWVALMPDCHSGYGMPIGGVLATKNVIIPNAVGVDIGCGMQAVKTSIQNIDNDTIKAIFGKIRETIPVGFSHHTDIQRWDGFKSFPDIEIIEREITSAKFQLGTLGGGNHFIEIQKGSDGFIWLMIHSGSRNIGLKTAKWFHEKAVSLCEKWASDIPHKDLAFLPIDTQEGRDYFCAMNFCLEFAKENRSNMMMKIKEIMDNMLDVYFMPKIDIHHNYAIFENHYNTNVIVHRKGATKASKGLTGIIPGSMGTSSYITEGLGNPESFNSCSHGAGRKMGRLEAIRTLNLEEEQRKMKGIVHGLGAVCGLDEAPGSYKDIDTVMENQKDLTKIMIRLSPLGVIKG